MKLTRVFFNSGVVVVLFLAFTLPQARAAGTCQAIFQSDADTQNNIDRSIKDLASFRLKLDEAKASGQSSVATTALESDYFKKEHEVFEFLISNKIMSREELIERIRHEIVDVQRNKSGKKTEEEQRREEQKREFKDALDPIYFAKKMIFQEIRPGKFKMGNAQVETEITQPFAMMSTQVTQMMWAKLKIVMGETDPDMINPSKFKQGTDSMVVNLDGIDVQMKQDHPVEKVSYDDVRDFIKGLNKLSRSNDTKTQELLHKLIPDHKQGDVYDLPTEAQWEFVMRDRGNANKQHFDRDDEGDLPNYAWYRENSGGTHAVATLNARMIDGQPFYDLEGNVWEWNKDRYDGTLKGGKDPQGTSAGSKRVIRGGSFFINAQSMRSDHRASTEPSNRGSDTGFRLVRVKGSSL